MRAERQKKIDDQLEKKNNCCQVVLSAFRIFARKSFAVGRRIWRWDVPGREVRCRHGHDYGCRFGLWLL